MELTFTVTLTEEQIKEAFENADVKFSKVKLKKIMDDYDLINNPDVLEELEQQAINSIEEIVLNEFGE